MKANILVIDDETDVRDTIAIALEDLGHAVKSADTGESALLLIKAEPFDLVITDIRMPGMGGVEVLKQVKKIDDTIEVIILTGYATIENAVETLRNDGAYDYLTKPLESTDTLCISVDQALERRLLRQENRKLTEELIRKQMELKAQNKVLHGVREELSRSEERFRVIASLTSDYFYSLSLEPDGTMVCDWIDGAFREITGYKPEKMGTLDDWLDVVHMEDRPGLVEKVRKISVDQRQVAEYRIVTKSGEERWLRDYVKPVLEQKTGRVQAVIGAVRDITQYKHAGAVLRENEKRLQLATSAGQVGVWDWDLGTDQIYIDPQLKSMLGFQNGDTTNQMSEWIRHVFSGDADNSGDPAVAHLDGAAPGFEIVHRMIRKNGDALWFLSRGTAMVDDNGRVRRVIGTDTNITDRVRVELALKESEGRYQFFVNHFKGIVFRREIDFSFEYLHGAVEEITGYIEDELVGGLLSWRQLIHVDDQPKMEDIFKNLNDIPHFTTEVEYRIVHKNGSTKWVNQYVQNICDDAEKPHSAIGIIYDITEQKRIEEQSRQSQMLKAVATLAGGVAHEFNNALVGITGNLELLRLGIEATPKLDKHMDGIKKSARRMALLTDQLLAYARGGKYQMEIVSLNEFVRETLPLLMHTIDSSVHIETDLPRNVAAIKGDLTQLRMALSAVLDNASESMGSGGRIRLITRNRQAGQKAAEHDPALPTGEYVCLTIQDEGSGMDKETRKRVFEPFFSTKFQGRGLGMAAAYGIIKNHGGVIRIEPHPEQGTLVHLLLPAVQGALAEVVNEAPRMVSGRGRVLVVDDEPMVLEVTRSMLEKMGYDVICAGTGAEAIDRVMTHHDDIDLMLLDVKLPDMGGNEVYRRIKQECPGIKVIICSGYALDAPISKLLDAGAEGFIQKPFSLNTLSIKVNQLIEND